MISVPDSIKEKLHLDHCQKNIRIHFPNGERSDICNDLIVKDTVNFTESLCSQDSLKFGLCEASTFECESVGVGNIKDAEIDVTCEVYCDQTISGAEWRTDLQHYVYPIQYGLFTVASCQRQADMNHRKITAYGGSGAYDWGISLYEKMLGQFALGGAFSISQYPLEYMYMNANLLNFDSDIWLDYPSQQGILNDFSLDLLQSAGLKITLSGKFRGIINAGVYPANIQTIKGVNHSADRRELFERMILHCPYGSASETDLANAYEQAVRYCNPKYRGGMAGNPTEVTSMLDEFPANFWYDGGYIGSSQYLFAPIFVVEATLKLRVGSGPFRDYEYTVPCDEIESAYSHCLKFNGSSTYRDFPIVINSIKGQDNKYRLDFSEAPNAQTMMQSASELYGLFGFFDRNNSFRFLNIKQQFGLLPSSTLYPGTNVYPEGVTGGNLLPQDYQSCWYDDAYSIPFGAITCTFTDTNNEKLFLTYYLTGYDEDSDIASYKVYDFSDNEIISGNLWTQAQIEALCQIIASNIEGVTYMPVEFVGRGLPYVEAGDTFEILTKSNDSITTIVLHRTLAGEQTLTDTYRSV